MTKYNKNYNLGESKINNTNWNKIQRNRINRIIIPTYLELTN